MFDKHMYKIISGVLAMCCFFTGSAIVSLICIIFEIGMLVFAIKKAKESPEGLEMIMLDVFCIVIALIISLVMSIYECTIELSFQNDPNHLGNSKTQSETSITPEEWVETAIFTYKIQGDETYTAKGFGNYLKQELGITDVKVKGNNVTFSINLYQITCKVTKQDITYKIQ